MSFPGLLLPLFIAAFGLVLASKEVRALWLPIVLCWIANVPFVFWQMKDGGFDVGLHLVTFLPLVVFWMARKTTVSLWAAYAATWLSMIVPDFVAAFVQAIFFDEFANLITPFFWMGGAGWKDGLFVMPIVGVVSALVGRVVFLERRAAT